MATEAPETLLLGGRALYKTRLARAYDILTKEVVRDFRRAELTWTDRRVLFAIGVLRMVSDIFVLSNTDLPHEIATKEAGPSETNDGTPAKHKKVLTLVTLTGTIEAADIIRLTGYMRLMRQTIVDQQEDIQALTATVTGLHRQIDKAHRQLPWLGDCMEQVLHQFDVLPPKPQPMQALKPEYEPTSREPINTSSSG
ncbi:hypothetical protein L2E82_36073 [Cichorium intybus]|uniref:Uncharacterized protein n=1 Tax=Cichorium intybus TaxID=13427 RepID=A0ACB9BQK2_CICIN|nr:hypothetical protein L2E82_36073 [Cichorium intybus]